VGRYLAAVDKAVDHTPPHRNRVVDTWRVIALVVVVFGHWLAASIWVQPDGTITVLNTLEWIPYAGWATWIVQVMPIFFFVGGYASAKALEARSTNRRSWITNRFRRLYTPTVPVILVWVVLTLVLANFIDADLVYAGVLNATIPLWFLAVYLTLVAVAPLTYAWWQRARWATVVIFAAAAIAVDIAYISFGVPGVGWLNLFFVWATIHQFGYAWSAAETAGTVISPTKSFGLSAIALATLVLVTGTDLYPVNMITIPGGGPSNVTPPTSAMILLAIAHVGIILGTREAVSRLSQRRQFWKGVVGVSGFMMTIYVWHLTALSLVIALGIFTFDGAAFSPEPGTTVWWLTRPVFYAVLAAATLLLVLAFGRFEHDIATDEQRYPLPVVFAGMGAAIIVLSATAFVFIVDRDANIKWWVPVLAVIAAAVLHAYPASWRAARKEPVESALG